jgi:5,10-methylenetetrahydromethanopterin reductase
MVLLDMLVIPEPDLGATVDMVRFLESRGFGCAWIGDSPPLDWPDVYVTLALCGVQTSRIALAPGVTNPVTRHASVTANALVTLHRLSGGRMKLGIGLGYSAVRAAGLKPARLQELTTYVAALRRTFEERNVSIPIYVAASGPRTLMTAGQLGDGAMVTVGTHPVLVRRALEYIGRGAREAGRDPRRIDVAFLAGLAISPDPEEARREASPVAARRALDAKFHPEFFLPPELEYLREDAERVARHYDIRHHTAPDAPHTRLVTDALVDAFTLAGTPEQCRQKLQAMEAAGATRVALFPSGKNRRGAVELFAQALLPQKDSPP